LNFKRVLFLATCLVLAVPAWSGYALSLQEHQVLKNWLARHSEYRQATDEDCDCVADMQQMRGGYGGQQKPVPGYHPYSATGDFNGDGVEDFATVLIDRRRQARNFALIVFNGPFQSEPPQPAFMESDLNLKYEGLFYGPPRPKPYRLLLGPFETDSGSLLIPNGRGYRWDDSRE
jgi:hypothetical protein